MNLERNTLAAVALVCMMAVAARAADAPPASALPAQAAAAYDAGDWTTAARLYEQIAASAPVPRAWYRLGVALRNLGQGERAIAAFQSGLKVGLPPFQAEFGIATVHAVAKDNEKAFAFLHKALDNGFNMPAQITGEDALSTLRGDPRYALAVERATRNQKPCANAPEHRQFDFWLGQWDVVTTAGGMPAGQSRIELILGDCVVLENWESAGSGYAGKSYNVYNAALKRWEQFWADNAAGTIFFSGGLKNGVMDYATDDIPQPDGTRLRRHLQFFNLGADKVRQFSQGSNDGGKTWTIEYDFTYNRKK